MRTVRFPGDRSIGKLLHRVHRQEHEAWEEYCDARGAVPIPENGQLALEVDNTDDLSPLDDFRPDDLFSLTLWKLFSLQDDELQHVGRLTGLHELLMPDAWGMTDAGLIYVEGLANLELLYLDGAHHMTDAGMVHLTGLTKLRKLSLWGTQARDEGLRHLLDLPLEELALSYTNVSDEGLRYIKAHRRLRRLDISGTRITTTGVDALRRALPRCSIDHSC